jgi:hypothetical protein
MMLYFKVNRAWNKIIISIPDEENWRMVAAMRTARPTLDLDFSIFNASLIFLINRYCIAKEIRIIKLKNSISCCGIM